MLHGKIFLYKNSHFTEIDLSELSVSDMQALLSMYKRAYQEDYAVIYNAVKIGTVGEEWPGKTGLMKVILDH